MKKLILFFLSYLLCTGLAISQVKNPVKWQTSYKYISQTSVELKFYATIEKGWHMYGAFFPDGGPIATTFHLEPSTEFVKNDTIKEITTPEKKQDPNFDNMLITMHSGNAEFSQKVTLKKPGEIIVKGYVEFMVCDDQRCLPPKNEEFVINIKPSAIADTKQNSQSSKAVAEADTAKEETVKNSGTANKNDSQENSMENKETGFDGSQSLFSLFLKALLAGLGAIFTPCVYPMIPLTVMFFLRGSEKKSKAVLKGLYFGLSIVIIYSLLGILFGQFLQASAQHWITNLFFFILFVVFALSFLGLFEIVLPSSLATKVDQQADKGGYFSIFFMALALVIVSVSCTVPLLGYVIVESASNLKSSITGMLGYSIAFALPFSLFAMFPSILKNLPNSGGWLNVFKVIIGLILFLFSFKYLVIVDQSLHLNFLSREIVISIWTATFFLTGFYLLGKIKLPHDSEIQHISVPRFILALASFTFGIYFLANLFFGGNLSAYASYFPSKSVRPAIAISSPGTESTNLLCGTPKYSNLLSLPHGLQGYFDYKEGIECAKKQNKPVLLDFKGHSCANCKIMEAKVWSNPEVLKLLKDNFIIIALYADERTKLPENEWITSKIDGKTKKTVGQLNEDIEISMFKTNALPLYAIVSPDGTPIVRPIGTELNVQKYIEFLKEGIKKFENLKI